MYKTYIKRLFDIVFATIILVLTLPIGLIVIIAVKVVNDGSVIFRQKRFGRNRQPFVMYKFRTMSESAPAEMPTNSLKGAHSHITKPGKIIRKLSLDELPQLVNVLKGDMSIVGPRPVILSEIDLITEREKYGANACKPGITGWAQVNGRDELLTKKKAKLDGEYVNNFGFFMDMKCVLMTIHAVLLIKGHKEGADEIRSDIAWDKSISGTAYGSEGE